MTVRILEQYFCDRCEGQFEKRAHPARIVTLALGWFKYVNGSGSKRSSSGREWDNLDYDLCPDCTAQFLYWWENTNAQVEDYRP